MRHVTTVSVCGCVVLFTLAESVRAATLEAASGSRADIQSAVDAAEPGDIVQIPAGNFEFTGKVILSKSIEIAGAGPPLTRLRSVNASGENMFTIAASDVTIRDLSLFGRPQGSGAIQDYGIQINNAIDFVIWNCHFEDFGGAGISVSGADARGVISSCRLTNIYRPEIANHGYGVLVMGGGAPNWSQPLGLGSDRFVFVEDSLFVGNRHAIASNAGSRYVFRFNHTRNPAPDNSQHIDAHGLEYGSSRGSRAYEIYGNLVEDQSGLPSWAGVTIRGGDGCVYDNAFLGNVNNPVFLCNRMDGTSTCDYPNLDQTTELYVWNNVKNGAAIGLSITSNVNHSCLFEQGRDYFYSPPEDYMPFPYPHPLLDRGGIGPDDGGPLDPDGGSEVDGGPSGDCSPEGGDVTGDDSAVGSDGDHEAPQADLNPGQDDSRDDGGIGAVETPQHPSLSSGCACASGGGRGGTWLSWMGLLTLWVFREHLHRRALASRTSLGLAPGS